MSKPLNRLATFRDHRLIQNFSASVIRPIRKWLYRTHLLGLVNIIYTSYRNLITLNSALYIFWFYWTVKIMLVKT